MTNLFAEQERVESDRQALQRELTDRLARLYEKHFTFNELNFLRAWQYGVCQNEAYEIARAKLEQKGR